MTRPGIRVGDGTVIRTAGPGGTPGETRHDSLAVDGSAGRRAHRTGTPWSAHMRTAFRGGPAAPDLRERPHC